MLGIGEFRWQCQSVVSNLVVLLVPLGRASVWDRTVTRMVPSPSTGSLPGMSFPWRRVLWERCPYPDNFIPPDSFLSALRRNRQ